MPKPPPRRPPRARKSADASRHDILDAAERVFATAMPDAVGLKEVAAEAGVSHGLVTHYFGTYRALVDATLERRISTARNDALARLVQASFGAPGEWPLLSVLIDFVQDPLTGRLLTWALLAGGAQAEAAFGVERRGLRLLVDAMTARFRAAMGDAAPSRERVEVTVVLGIVMTLGLAIGGDIITKSLGHDGPLDLARMAPEIHTMLRGYLLARGTGA